MFALGITFKQKCVPIGTFAVPSNSLFFVFSRHILHRQAQRKRFRPNKDHHCRRYSGCRGPLRRNRYDRALPKEVSLFAIFIIAHCRHFAIVHIRFVQCIKLKMVEILNLENINFEIP